MSNKVIKIDIERIKTDYKNLENEISEYDKHSQIRINEGLGFLNDVESEFANKVKRELSEVVQKNRESLVNETNEFTKSVKDAAYDFKKLDDDMRKRLEEYADLQRKMYDSNHSMDYVGLFSNIMDYLTK